MKRRKLITMILLFALSLTLVSAVACGNNASETTASPAAETTVAEVKETEAEEATEPAAETTAADVQETEAEAIAEAEETPAEEDVKVAMILTSSVNDAGWGESAYRGLEQIKSELEVETAFTEQAQQADFESIMRDYATKGFNVLILVGNEFSDVALKVAPTFPDVKFCVMNGNESMDPNVAAYRFNTPETGFLAGVLAALYSEKDSVAMIGGATYPHIQDALDAFVVGAKYINPDIEAKTGNTESMTDIARGKEMGLAFIEQGADVLSANANATGLGVIDAAKTEGIRYIGYISDQYEEAPDTIMVSMVQSNEVMMVKMVQDVIDGNFKPQLHLLGMNDDAIYISDFHGHDAELPEGGKEKIDEIVAGIKDGSLKEQGILPKSIFEVEEP